MLTEKECDVLALRLYRQMVRLSNSANLVDRLSGTIRRTLLRKRKKMHL